MRELRSLSDWLLRLFRPGHRNRLAALRPLPAERRLARNLARVLALHGSDFQRQLLARAARFRDGNVHRLLVRNIKESREGITRPHREAQHALDRPDLPLPGAVERAELLGIELQRIRLLRGLAFAQ